MRTLTVADVVKMSAGEIVPALKCRLKAAYPRESGTSANGDWTRQNITVDDGHGHEIKAQVWNKEAIHKDYGGSWMTLLCSQSEKHGLTGLKLAENNYQGKTSIILKVTASALIEFGDEHAPEKELAPPTQQPAPATRPTGQAPASPADRIKSAKTFLGKRANGMRLCLDAADYIADEYAHKHSEPLAADQYQAITSSLFIAGDRAGVFDDLPAAPLEKFTEEYP